jgi:hypothetical protein
MDSVWTVLLSHACPENTKPSETIVSEGLELGAGAGFEPAASFFQAVVDALSCELGQSAERQPCAQRLWELAELVKTWPQVTPEIRSAVLTLVRTTTGAQK